VSSAEGALNFTFEEGREAGWALILSGRDKQRDKARARDETLSHDTGTFNCFLARLCWARAPTGSPTRKATKK